MPQLPPPTMKDLSNLVHTTKPYDLGLTLNIAENDLNIMQLDHRNDFGSQLRQVLSLYLRQTEAPSWAQVATALCDMKEMPSANAIQKKFGIKNHAVIISATTCKCMCGITIFTLHSGFSLPGRPEPAAAPASATPLVPALPSGYQQSPAQYPAGEWMKYLYVNSSPPFINFLSVWILVYLVSLCIIVRFFFKQPEPMSINIVCLAAHSNLHTFRKFYHLYLVWQCKDRPAFMYMYIVLSIYLIVS